MMDESVLTTAISRPPEPSTLTERLARQRQDRHDSALQDLHLALARVRQDHEAVTQHAMATLKSAWTPEAYLVTAALVALEAMPPMDTNAAATAHDDAWVALYRRAGAVTGHLAVLHAALHAGEQAHRAALAKTLQAHHAVLTAVALELPAATDRLVLAEGMAATLGLVDTRRAAALVRAEMAAYALRLQGRIAVGRAVALRRAQACVGARVSRDLCETLAGTLPSLPAAAVVLAAPLAVLTALQAQAASLVPPRGADGWAAWSDALKVGKQQLSSHVASASKDARESLTTLAPVVALAVATAQSLLFVVESLVDGDAIVTTNALHESNFTVDCAALQALAEKFLQETTQAVLVHCEELGKIAERTMAPLEKLATWLGSALQTWQEHKTAVDARKAALAASLTAMQTRSDESRAGIERQIGLAVDALRQAGTPEELRAVWATVTSLLHQNDTAHTMQQTAQAALLPAFPEDVNRLVTVYTGTIHAMLASSHGMLLLPPSANPVVAAWLQHVGVDGWPTAAATHARQHVDTVAGTLADEHALFRTIYAARLQRLERDVHNVRAAELVLHRERVTQHGRGLEAGLVALHARFSAAPLDSGVAAAFASTVEGIEHQLKGLAPDQSASMSGLQTRLKTAVDAYCTDVRQHLRAARGVMGAALHDLREANGALRTSLRSFAEGGNFSAEEVVSYSSVVQALAARIDTTEGVLLGTLEGAEAAAVKEAHATMTHLSGLVGVALRDAAVLSAKASAARRLHLAVFGQGVLVDRQAANIDAALAVLTKPARPPLAAPENGAPLVSSMYTGGDSGSSTLFVIEGAAALVLAMEKHAAFLGPPWSGFDKGPPDQMGGESINLRMSLATSLTVPGSLRAPKYGAHTSLPGMTPKTAAMPTGAGSVSPAGAVGPVMATTGVTTTTGRRLQPRPPPAAVPQPGNKFVARSTDEPHVIAPWLSAVPEYKSVLCERQQRQFVGTRNNGCGGSSDELSLCDSVQSSDEAGFWRPIAAAMYDALATLLAVAGPYYDALRGKAPACGTSVLEETLTRFIDARQTELQAEVARAAVIHDAACASARGKLRSAAAALQNLALALLSADLLGKAKSSSAIVSQDAAVLSAALAPLNTANAALFSRLRPNLGHPNNAALLQQLVDEEAIVRVRQEQVLAAAADRVAKVAATVRSSLADHEAMTDELACTAARLAALYIALDQSVDASAMVTVSDSLMSTKRSIDRSRPFTPGTGSMQLPLPAASLTAAVRATTAERLTAHVLGRDCAAVVAAREAQDLAALQQLAPAVQVAGREARAVAGGGGAQLQQVAIQAQTQLDAATKTVRAGHLAWDRAVQLLPRPFGAEK